jgi:2-C-methyl-D-erythritol 4-phosphate cytidylyltransferase/2-C-methyl-D-erythritol 2,4-cyclodiphosphate synthase
MRTAGLVVAAGRGLRLGGEIPKQYQSLGQTCALAESLRVLLEHPAIDRVLAVIHPDDRPLYDAAVAAAALTGLCSPVAGGATRSASVRQGLEALAAHPPDRVLIHDAARPFVPAEVITALLAALETEVAALPALPVVDALWHGPDSVVGSAVDRADLWRAQTPQAFRFVEILAAHRAHSGDAVDDIAVARAAGHAARLVPGAEENFKLTTAADLARARHGIAGAVTDVRTGNGFDVHAFTVGDAVTLCGVTLPFDRALSGHSDADVGMHAVTDAIFGALGEGDIGQWFPPSDPQWKGAASAIFLRKAIDRAAARGFRISHLDCTLICEAPPIGPHAGAMRTELARHAGLDPERISVKATTSERLGFTGRGEGIAALATATLVRG